MNERFLSGQPVASVWPLSMAVCLLFLVATADGLGETRTTTEAVQQQSSTGMVAAANGESENAQQHIAGEPQKKILNDESRGLGGFFMIGMAINVVLAITFGLWFRREWRKDKSE